MKMNWFWFFHNLMNHPTAGMDLRNYDFSKYKVIQTPFTWKNADLSYSYGLHGNVNFQSFNRLNLSNVDFRFVTSVKFNLYAEEINLSGTKGLYGNLPFGCIGKLGLRKTDMKKIFRLQCAKDTDLSGATNLFGFFDCKDTDYLNLSDTDVGHAKFRFNPNGKKVNLTNVKGLSGVLNFGNTEHVILFGADLSKVTKIIVGPNTDLSGVVGFTGEIEYLTSKKLSQQVAGTKHMYRNQAKRQAYRYAHIGAKLQRHR